MSTDDLPPLILAAADTEPVVGAQVVDHEGLTWANWLLGRIAEDEQAAREVQRGQVWGIAEERPQRWGDMSPDPEIIGDGKPIIKCNAEYGGYFVALHVERWQPARVLAECGAKRRVIAEYQYWHRKLLTNPDYPALADRYEVAATMLRALTTAYADHPGCRPEWVP